MKKAKVILSVILVVAAIIIILQNTATVETKLLFFTISMPRALLLAITALVGYALGILTALGSRK